MYVVKRDGHKEPVMFDKITERIKKLCYGLNELVDPVKVAMRVIEGLYDGVSTSELDNLAAETAARSLGAIGRQVCELSRFCWQHATDLRHAAER